jgi:hypothetical protein
MLKKPTHLKAKLIAEKATEITEEVENFHSYLTNFSLMHP